MDPALIALPATALLTGGLGGFLCASIAFDRKQRREPLIEVYRTTPAAPIKVEGQLTENAAAMLTAQVDRLHAQTRTGTVLCLPDPFASPSHEDTVAETIVLASDAIRHGTRAIAELARFQHAGPGCDRFPLDEDVEVDLAKALQATVNILLAYQPSEGDREELGQLEAALHKFITDYGA